MTEYDLEEDMHSADWFVTKVQDSRVYAQNLYAAFCNTDFVPVDVWGILTNVRWNCSWRQAAVMIAEIHENSDYLDWYCSGIGGGKLSEGERNNMSEESIARYEWMAENFVGEGHVTDEIQADLVALGWIVIDDNLDE